MKKMFLLILVFAILTGCERLPKDVVEVTANQLFYSEDFLGNISVKIRFKEKLRNAEGLLFSEIQVERGEETKFTVKCPEDSTKTKFVYHFDWVVSDGYSSSAVQHIFPDSLTLFAGISGMLMFGGGAVGEVKIADHKWSSGNWKHNVWITNKSDKDVTIELRTTYFSSRGVKLEEHFDYVNQTIKSNETKNITMIVPADNTEIIKTSSVKLSKVYYSE
jgi:uncharacterized protein YcfL